MADPKLVDQVATWMMKNPGKTVQFDTFPKGTAEAVSAELNRRDGMAKDRKGPVQKQIDADLITSPEEQQAAAAEKAKSDENPFLDPSHPGVAGAALSGLTNGISAGFADELGGIGGSALAKVNNAIVGHPEVSDSYLDNRNEIRQLQANSAEQHPAAYHIANLLGALAMPIKGAQGATLGARALNGAETGIKLGAVAGLGNSNADLAGMSNNHEQNVENIDRTVEDIGTGAGMGGLFGAAIPAAGAVAKPIVSKLAQNMLGASKTLDPVLLRYLFPGKEGSDMITTLMSRDAQPASEAAGPGASEVADVVRSNWWPDGQMLPNGPQAIKDAIQVPKTAVGARGTLMNPIENVPQPEPAGHIPATMEPMPTNGPKPGAWTPQAGPSQRIVLGPKGGWDAEHLYQNATPEELNSIAPAGPAAYRGKPAPQIQPPQPQDVNLQAFTEPPPEPTPLSPAERLASQGLANASNAPSLGMPPSTIAGGVQKMFMKYAQVPAALSIPRMGNKMLELLNSPVAGQTANAVTMKTLISHVLSSPDPSFSDYLAKETFPEYLALSQQAAKKVTDENETNIDLTHKPGINNRNDNGGR